MHWLKWAKLIGVGLLLWILATVDWKRVLPTIASLKLKYVAAYLLCFACMILVRVVRLHVCTRKLGFPLRLPDSYAATVEPAFMGAVTPGRIGEFSRVAYLRRNGMPLHSAIALALLERMIDLSVLLCFGAGGILYLFGASTIQSYASGVIAILLVLLYASFSAITLVTPHVQRLFATLWRVLSLPGGAVREKVWGAFTAAVSITAPTIEVFAIACTLLNLLQIYLLACAFGFTGNRIAICFAYTISSVMTLLPISPAGLGTREAAYIFILARQGIGREQALLFSLLEGGVLGVFGPLVMAAPLWIGSVMPAFYRRGNTDDSAASVHRLNLVVRSIRKRGLLETLKFVAGEISFDWTFRTDTTAPVPVAELSVTTDNKAHAAPYQGTSWFLLKRVFGTLIRSGQTEPQRTCLMDFGCGKGRVMLAALHFRIKKVIGVEFDGNLCAVCRENLMTYTRRKVAGQAVAWEVINSDASEVEIPPEVNLFFLYNPFGGPPLEAVAQRIYEACRASGERLLVIYVNPVHERIFQHLGFSRTADSDDDVAILALERECVPNSMR
jgi:uncharacterized membrane protein YbhN (UPF0104 family)